MTWWKFDFVGVCYAFSNQTDSSSRLFSQISFATSRLKLNFGRSLARANASKRSPFAITWSVRPHKLFGLHHLTTEDENHARTETNDWESSRQRIECAVRHGGDRSQLNRRSDSFLARVSREFSSNGRQLVVASFHRADGGALGPRALCALRPQARQPRVDRHHLADDGFGHRLLDVEMAEVNRHLLEIVGRYDAPADACDASSTADGAIALPPAPTHVVVHCRITKASDASTPIASSVPAMKPGA